MLVEVEVFCWRLVYWWSTMLYVLVRVSYKYTSKTPWFWQKLKKSWFCIFVYVCFLFCYFLFIFCLTVVKTSSSLSGPQLRLGCVCVCVCFQWFEVRGGCSFCWYWWNCGPITVIYIQMIYCTSISYWDFSPSYHGSYNLERCWRGMLSHLSPSRSCYKYD
jgi:hypothetical protein